MNNMLKPIAFSLLFASTAAPAFAAAATPPAAPLTAPGGVNGIATASLDAVISNSNAFKNASLQRQTTYKSVIDQADARTAQIKAQMQPLYTKFVKDRTAGVVPAVLEHQMATLQQIEDSGKKEIEQIIAPIKLSEAYGMEQINAKMQTAVPTAMQKAGVALLLRREAEIAGGPSTDISPAILTELNAELPSIQVVPPAGWVPAAERAQKAQADARGTASDGGR